MKTKISVLLFIIFSTFGGAMLIDFSLVFSGVVLLCLGFAGLILFPMLVDILEGKF